MNSPSAGGVDVRSRNTSPSPIVSNVQDVKRSINTNLNTRLKELITNPPRRNSKDVCLVTRIMSKMTEEDKQFLELVMDDERIYASAIIKALKEEGYDLSYATFCRHRRKDCGCYK